MVQKWSKLGLGGAEGPSGLTLRIFFVLLVYYCEQTFKKLIVVLLLVLTVTTIRKVNVKEL